MTGSGKSLSWDNGAASRRGTWREKRKVRMRAVGMLGESFMLDWSLLKTDAVMSLVDDRMMLEEVE